MDDLEILSRTWLAWNHFFTQEGVRRCSSEVFHRFQDTWYVCVGCGGLAHFVVPLLAGMGARHFIVLDGDRVEKSNLARQPLYTLADVGKKKVEVFARALRNRFPHLDILEISEYLTENRASAWFRTWKERYADRLLVLDCADRLRVSFLLGDLCQEFRIPWILGAVVQGEILLASFPEPWRVNLRHVFPQLPPDSLLPACEDAGVFPVVVAQAGIWMVQEAVTLALLGTSPLSGKLLRMEWDPLTREWSMPEIVEIPEESDACHTVDETKKRTISPQENISITAELSAGPKFPSPMREEKKNSPEVQAVSPDVLHSWLQQNPSKEELLLVDLRIPLEYEMATIPGARNFFPPLYLEELKQEIRASHPARKVVLFCTAGVTSEKILKQLQEEFPDRSLYHLEGGIEGWFLAGYPLSKGKSQS